MPKLLKLVLFYLALQFVISPQSRADSAPCAVIGYLPHYRLDTVTADQLTCITDLIYFGIEPTADGQLPDPVIPLPTIAKLKEIKKNHNCRILIAIGGWNRSKAFPSLAKSESARTQFINAMADFCKKHAFSGIDYDWEHPKNADELESYGKLIADTHERFQKDNLTVTVAQASWQNLGKPVYNLIDRIHLMSYDHDFPQATLEKSTADVQQLIEWGCPANKIALGVPFYGRNAKRESKAYHQLAASPDFDPSNDNDHGFAYNGRKTIAAKTNYVLKQKLAGIMIWELTQDSDKSSTSLLQSIQETIKSEHGK